MTIEEARAALVGQMLVAMGSAPETRGREMQLTMARVDDHALAVHIATCEVAGMMLG